MVFWSAYKRLINDKKSTNIPPIVVNNKFVTNFEHKSDIFNDYFATQCRPLDTDIDLPPFEMKKSPVFLSHVKMLRT